MIFATSALCLSAAVFTVASSAVNSAMRASFSVSVVSNVFSFRLIRATSSRNDANSALSKGAAHGSGQGDCCTPQLASPRNVLSLCDSSSQQGSHVVLRRVVAGDCL